MLARIFKSLCLAALCALSFGVTASADPLPKVEFNWTKEWANVSPRTNSVLNDVTRMLRDCADPTVQPSDIKMYKIDFNKDGLTDIIVDPAALQGRTLETCNAQPCVNGDCYLGVYLKKGKDPVQILVPRKKEDVEDCPKHASENKDCLPYCKATQNHCPELFQDQYQSIFNVRVGLWNIFSPTDMPLTTPHLQPSTQNGLVLFNHIYDQGTTACTDEELAVYLSSADYKRCLKFYQWDATTEYMYDLWTPTANTWQGVPDKDAYNLSLFNPETLVMNSRGPKEYTGNGSGFKLTKGMQVALNMLVGTQTICHEGCTNNGRQTVDNQPCNRTCYTNMARKCTVVTNTSNKDYFMPNNSDEEFNAFYHNPPPGVTFSACANKYTPWKGEDSIANWLNQQPVGTSITGDACGLSGKGMYCDIAFLWGVNRDCINSLGVTIDPAICAADESIAAADRALGVVQRVTCYGPATCIRSVSCVADTTMIKHKDGSKLARELKIGDEILTFTHDHPEKLFSSTIKDIKITPDKQVIEINHGLRVTTNHYFVTANRGKVVAEDLQIRDILVKSDGTKEPVSSIIRLKDKITVYNFYTEKGDGFVADNILVYSITAGAADDHKK